MARTKSTMFVKALVVTAAAVLMSTSATSDTSNPFLGKWALDLEKSTFHPPPSGMKSQTIIVTDAAGGGTHNVIDTVGADGSTFHVEYTSANDGKSVPTTGDPDSDSIVQTSINSKTVKSVWLKAGKVTAAGTLTISKSGKTFRGPFHGTNADGSKWKNYLVYVRQ